jgi:hypothetical protein
MQHAQQPADASCPMNIHTKMCCSKRLLTITVWIILFIYFLVQPDDVVCNVIYSAESRLLAAICVECAALT